MTERAGFVQGPPDISTGKRISSASVTLPAGTVVTNYDGTTTTLLVDTVVYLQRVVFSDPETLTSAAVSGESGRGKIGVEASGDEQRLASIDESLKEILALLKMELFGS